MKKRSNRYSPEQIVKKLRDADVMLTSSKEPQTVVPTLTIFDHFDATK
jgi:hypothetical protein